MNLGDLEAALALSVQDKSLEPYFKTWINNAILELAADFELPALKTITPVPLTVDTTTWLWKMPESYQKKLYRCADSAWSLVQVEFQGKSLDVSFLDRRDIDHDETGDHITMAAVVDSGGAYLAVYPKAAETLNLWFYEKPDVLVYPEDVPTCIPTAYHDRVILPKCIIKAYQYLQDQVENFDPKGLQYWDGKLREGLYGSPQGPIGLINYLVKVQGSPRRHGGRDPIWTGGRW